LTAAASPEAAPVEEAAAVEGAAAPVPAAPEEVPIQETAVPDTEVVVAVSADTTPAEDEILPVEETTSPAPAAPEEEHTEEAVVPVAEVVVASKVECMDAEEESAPAGETVALAIEVAAPIAEVVPSVAALDVDPEAPPGLLVYVCMCVRVCACVCVCVRVCVHISPLFFGVPLSPSLSILLLSILFSCTAQRALCLLVKCTTNKPFGSIHTKSVYFREDGSSKLALARSFGSHPCRCWAP